ncbi:MAG: hypothetical protein IKB56_03375, partial [Clostridia bacterium]|nr:hypothetical protein [Clostridia bacterium]
IIFFKPSKSKNALFGRYPTLKPKPRQGAVGLLQQPFGVLLLPWLASQLARFYTLNNYLISTSLFA